MENKPVVGNVLVTTRDIKATEIILEEHPAALGYKIYFFFSSHSLKTREKCISFAQFVYFLRKVCLLFDIIVNFIIQNLKSKHISL